MCVTCTQTFVFLRYVFLPTCFHGVGWVSDCSLYICVWKWVYIVFFCCCDFAWVLPVCVFVCVCGRVWSGWVDEQSGRWQDMTVLTRTSTLWVTVSWRPHVMHGWRWTSRMRLLAVLYLAWTVPVHLCTFLIIERHSSYNPPTGCYEFGHTKVMMLSFDMKLKVP